MATKERSPFSILEYIPSMKTRHSEYQFDGREQAPMEEVRQLLEDVLLYTPSAYNSQPVRIVLLTGEESRRHWELIREILKEKIGEERYRESRGKYRIDNVFTEGVGTVLFFDDTTVTDKMIEGRPNQAEEYRHWAQQAQGSHRHMVWLGLKALGYGATL